MKQGCRVGVCQRGCLVRKEERVVAGSRCCWHLLKPCLSANGADPHRSRVVSSLSPAWGSVSAVAGLRHQASNWSHRQACDSSPACVSQAVM